jgi:hypothetical protein
MRRHGVDPAACDFHSNVEIHVRVHAGTIIDKMGSAMDGVPCHSKMAYSALEPHTRKRRPWDQCNVRERDAARRHVEARLGHREPRVDIGYMGYVRHNGHGVQGWLLSKVPFWQADARGWLYSWVFFPQSQ